MQTMKIRIAIEQKVKDSYDAAKFQERHAMLEKAIQDSTRKQESLKVQVDLISKNWGDYYEKALTEIKDRFTSINSSTFVAYLDQQKIEAEKLDRELEIVTGEVKQLEIEVDSTTSTMASDRGDDEGE